MEGEREDWGESTESGTTSTQVDKLTQGCSEEGDGPQNLQEPTGDDRVDSEACDGLVDPAQVGEDLRISDTDDLPQESLTPTNTQNNADGLPSPPLPSDEEVTPPLVSSHHFNKHNRSSVPCWYCMRSLDSDYRPETPEQEDSVPSSPLLSSGQKVSYQTDPRPHFGVAWSSHSTCRPLWGSEGPCWGQRHQDAPNQMHTCPHCHLGLPPDTLRWHEAKCLLYDGLRNSNK
nr:PREDICTED: uncharacterized protein LOC109628382 [Paralichthys olivaceus]